MGASGSKIEEEKALKLCRERKKYVHQALDGRCSLAAAHVAYIETLRSTGTALKKFVELEAPVESSFYTSTNATPEPLALTEKSVSQFSYYSPSFSQRVDATETFSPSPSPHTSSHFQANHMKFGVMSSKKVEEKPSLPDIRLVTSSSTPQNTTPRSTEKPESLPFEASSLPPGTPHWDFFGLWHPIDHQLSFQEEKELNQGSETVDHLRQLREEEGLPELEDEEGASLYEREETHGSEDEFDDEPPTDTLVRSFENLNRVNDHKVANASSTIPSAGSVASETDFLNGEKSNSPDLSPLGATLSGVSIPTEIKKTPVKEDDSENKVAPKDFPSVMKDIEFLFIKASDSGKEVPRMLEANKLHFRPIFPAKEGGLTTSTFFRACFSCGEDPSQVKEEPPQTAVKYLTWHRTTSSRSSSSENPLGLNSKDDVEDLVYNTCMISGSHVSTLDRLYAWERKLYDEVKASELIRSEYDLKCKSLRQLESRAESSSKIDKTRAVIKDLHSRIRVAIHRIHSISKRIEDLRDNELQPQLEELIEGLSRMWEVMSECHRRQFQIISVAYNTGNMKISVLSESHRQITARLEDELSLLSSSFTKWIGAQKAYLKAINSWLEKCVSFPQKSLKGSYNRKDLETQILRKHGPTIYVTCGAWYDKLDDKDFEPHIKNVSDSIKRLGADTSGFLPHQEKNEGKNATNHPYSASGKDDNSDSAINMSRDDAMKERISASRKDDDISDSAYNMFRNNALKDSFGTSLVFFLGQLKSFAEASAKMYAELDKEIQDKRNKDMSVQGAEIGNDESNVQSNNQSTKQSSSSNQSSNRSKDQLKSQV